MPHKYNNPAGGTDSSVGKQFRTNYWYKKALLEARKEQYFTQLASTIDMPKNMGKEIVRFHYIPLLDDRNVNDQGIDANGATIANGNLYGSSKDIGNITGKLPTLSENGGRVNRVGFKRLTLKGSFEKFGFFYEYTKESLDFDTDDELESHLSREMLNGANEITEDAIQLDLLSNAGVVKYAGSATSTATVDTNELTYKMFVDLDRILTDNRTPKQTTVITGTRMVDTKTIPACRVMYIGSEIKTTILRLKDFHGNAAFIPVEKYGAGTSVLTGEIGSVYGFRLVEVPEMLKWAGAGSASSDPEYYTTNGNLDVFPCLVVGDSAFTTIGFQTDGKSTKFKIINKKPGEKTADLNDPYGEKGFSSIKWYYGFMPIRPERIALMKVAAKM